MTKLLEWLAVFGTLGAIWLALVTNKVETNVNKQHPNLILYSPIIFVGLFGLYLLILLFYRTFTFNNCEEAAAELQEELKEARADLTRLGFKFKTK